MSDLFPAYAVFSLLVEDPFDTRDEGYFVIRMAQWNLFQIVRQEIWILRMSLTNPYYDEFRINKSISQNVIYLFTWLHETD